MARPLRIQYEGAVYHITARGNERRDIFADRKDFSRFLELLGRVHERYGVLVHAYALMANHVLC
jgi:REP element-mobilizing transposase RayT